jgi:hypothetical protein
MYGNDNWINSYLDAILDAGKGAAGAGAGAARGRSGGGVGGGGGYGERPSLLLRERGHFSPARYFVEEVITGYDETDLYKTWLRVRTCPRLLSPPACAADGGRARGPNPWLPCSLPFSLRWRSAGCA